MSEMRTRETEDRTAYRVWTGPGGRLGACLLVAPDETESDVAVVEHTLAPGRLGSPRHRHTREDAVSLIYAGRMTYMEDGETRTAGAGDVVVKPRGRWHAFWNAGDETLRFYEVIAPGTFAWYFAESASCRSAPGFEANGDDAEIRELDRAYGLDVDYESVPALVEAHDLRP